jgi:DNA-binding GntR family transcriptional regulator
VRTDPSTEVIARGRTIGAQVHALLRGEIIAGRLLPGAALSEHELSQRFGVSRTPIREALIKLAEDHLVEIFPQYGSFVTRIKLRAVFDSQFIREALECAAVEKAVERIDEARAEELIAVIERQRELHRAGDEDGFFLADERLHALILETAGHGGVWQCVASAKAQMDRVRFLAMRIPRKQTAVIAEHAGVVERLIERDRDGAVAAMRRHLRTIFQTVEILKSEKSNLFADGPDAASSPPPPPPPAQAPDRRRTAGSRLGPQVSDDRSEQK